MPVRNDQRRIIAGPRNRNFDRYISDLIRQRGYGSERTWHAIPDQRRADQIRRRLQQAGQHIGVSVKAFWQPGNGCTAAPGGCAFHVHYTAYDPAAARIYKRNQLAERIRNGS